MNTNVNLAAPIGALALMGTAFILVVAAAVLVQSLIARKPGRAKIVGLAILTLAGAYLGVMLIFSFVSHEKILARGQEKHFCELDCHLAYSVVSARQANDPGVNSNQTDLAGRLTVITIKTRFDETTISPQRGDGLLYPNSRALTLVDERGNRYGPASALGTPFTTPLRPGDSYTTDVAFDLPANVKPAALLINEGGWETHLVIGHENSPWHKKTQFQL